MSKYFVFAVCTWKARHADSGNVERQLKLKTIENLSYFPFMIKFTKVAKHHICPKLLPPKLLPPPS